MAGDTWGLTQGDDAGGDTRRHKGTVPLCLWHRGTVPLCLLVSPCVSHVPPHASGSNFFDSSGGGCVKEVVYLGLGSNTGDKCENLKEARRLLEEHGKIRVVKESSFYLTDPWGKTDQEQFVNQVLAVETELDPFELLEAVLAVERKMGRVRREKWGPRNIDIDILLFGEQVIDSPHLVVPHPRLPERAFVLVPLLEIDPNVSLPGGKGVRAIWENLVSEQETGCIKKLSCDKMSQRNIENG